MIALDEVLGTTFESVLTDHDRTAFAGLEILRDQQDSVRNHIGEDIHHHFVAGPAFTFVGLTGAGRWGEERFVEAADDFFGELFAVGFDGTGMGFDGRGVETLHERAAYFGADGEEMLVVAIDLVELPELAGGWIGQGNRSDGRVGFRGKTGAGLKLLEEGFKRLRGGERALAIVASGQDEGGAGLEGLDQALDPVELGVDRGGFRRDQS